VLFVDISATGLGEDTIAERLERIARVKVVPGSPRWFGPGAAGHIRLSLATTHAVLDEALARIERAWTEHGVRIDRASNAQPTSNAQAPRNHRHLDSVR
jgi:bifunctional pyridoxal-dependent enzyme with beta-cystathionase and maltose regulon repressor activities